MKDLQENVVPSQAQARKNWFLHKGSGLRVLFAGNSITKHGPKPSLGWLRDCGMGASDEAHDYVHLTVEKLRALDKNVSFAIAQVADFERDFQNPAVFDLYRDAKPFQADILVMFFGANVPKEAVATDEQQNVFGDAFEAFRNFLVGDNTRVFVMEGFYIRPELEAQKRRVCEKTGDVYLPIGEALQTDPAMHGVYNHPNDLGMQMLSDVLFAGIEPTVRKILRNP